MKSIMQPLYNFVRFICHIFEKCQNLGINNEKYYAATIQFCKILQFVNCNYHKFIFANQ